MLSKNPHFPISVWSPQRNQLPVIWFLWGRIKKEKKRFNSSLVRKHEIWISIYIYIYIYSVCVCVCVCVCVYLFRQQTFCRHILLKMTDKDLEVSFYRPFLIHECNVTNEDEGCLVIVRNLTCTFEFCCWLPWVWLRSRHRFWDVLCDQWIFWTGALIACSPFERVRFSNQDHVIASPRLWNYTPMLDAFECYSSSIERDLDKYGMSAFYKNGF